MNFWSFAWVLIPIAGIMAGAWSEWLKFKKEQATLGASADSLETSFQELAEKLEQQNATLITRIQNLEAIVTSADWDQLTDVSMPEALPEPEPEIFLPDPEEENREEAERIARKLRS
jgi:hypothetical protein